MTAAGSNHPMDNQLTILISVYEEEKARLQKLIDECVQESEYLYAHYHSQALDKITTTLHTLKNFEDRFYKEKDFRLERIAIWKQALSLAISDDMKEYYEMIIQMEEEDLEKLNQISKQQAANPNSSIFDDALVKLVEKKIKNLKLILKKTDNFFLGFTYSTKKLKVSLPYVRQHKKKRLLDDESITSFQNLGFDLSQNKLTLILSGNKEDILHQLKVILSKIVFEIFHFKKFDKESYIQFTEKIDGKPN